MSVATGPALADHAPQRAVPFCVPFRAPRELEYLADAIANGMRSGDGPSSRRARALLAGRVGGGEVLLTTSGTAALELALLVSDLQPGDEVILPSFTFASVANAVILRGAVPVFVDVDRTTLNVTAELIAPAITPRTRAVIAVHYAGVVCEMEPIMALARARGLTVIEDAAHAIGAMRDGRPAGSFGDFAAFSFHYTKNITCGEGGCLVINDPDRVASTEIAYEKGTDRRAFFRGLIDKYSWVAPGSSFIMGELNAAVLGAQLEAIEEITARRLGIWGAYRDACHPLIEAGLVLGPDPPEAAQHNGHLFHLITRSPEAQGALIAVMRSRQITAPFHYVPLHSSSAGQRYGRHTGDLPVTDAIWNRLVRLPLYPGLEPDLHRVVDSLHEWADLAGGS